LRGEGGLASNITVFLILQTNWIWFGNTMLKKNKGQSTLILGIMSRDGVTN
jgi:hypothetical protein